MTSTTNLTECHNNAGTVWSQKFKIAQLMQEQGTDHRFIQQFLLGNTNIPAPIQQRRSYNIHQSDNPRQHNTQYGLHDTRETSAPYNPSPYHQHTYRNGHQHTYASNPNRQSQTFPENSQNTTTIGKPVETQYNAHNDNTQNEQTNNITTDNDADFFHS